MASSTGAKRTLSSVASTLALTSLDIPRDLPTQSNHSLLRPVEATHCSKVMRRQRDAGGAELHSMQPGGVPWMLSPVPLVFRDE